MNRLKDEPSPYLRSAAHQPVHWWPWGAEAFAEARRRDVPILLDVGAVWCHWCHVMDRESYEDPAIAALLNERFVAVKVDRDERPDVDTRYQKAAQALTGQGGWPLTAFLLPDGRCFYAGTYFPPVEAHGRPSFRAVLEAVADFHAKERGKAEQQAAHLAEHLAPRPAPARAGVADAALVAAAERGMLEAFDAVNGGFGGAPKFPHPTAVGLLLRRAARGTAPPRAREAALETLLAMERGGIHDRLAGGFHRYSVDAFWGVPHFEKMLYDNAELLRNYAHAFQVTGDARHRRAAEGVVRFLDGTLAHPRGGWGASQDADVSLDDDGSWYTWTKAEVEAALPTDLARLAVQAWGVGEPGRQAEGRSVLYEAADAEAIAGALGRPRADVERDLARAAEGLLAARLARKAPFVDPTVYVSWNAMAASAMLEASAALDLPAARASALRALERILAEAYDAKRGAAHRLGDDGPAVWGQLDDQALLAEAFQEAFVHTQDRRFLDAAGALLDVLRRDFADARGGYADTAEWLRRDAPARPLAEPERPVGDHPTPAGNGAAARAHLRQALLAGDAAHARDAEEILRAFAWEARRFGLFAATYLQALDLHLDPAPHVTVVGAAGDAAADALVAAALAAYAPGKAVVRVEPGASAEGLPPEVAGMLAAARGPTAFVCRGGACAPPTTDPAEVARLVGKG